MVGRHRIDEPPHLLGVLKNHFKILVRGNVQESQPLGDTGIQQRPLFFIEINAAFTVNQCTVSIELAICEALEFSFHWLQIQNCLMALKYHIKLKFPIKITPPCAEVLPREN